MAVLLGNFRRFSYPTPTFELTAEVSLQFATSVHPMQCLFEGEAGKS